MVSKDRLARTEWMGLLASPGLTAFRGSQEWMALTVPRVNPVPQGRTDYRGLTDSMALMGLPALMALMGSQEPTA